MQTNNCLDSKELLGQWKREVRVAHISHQLAASYSDRPHAAQRSAAVVLSLMLGSGAVAYAALEVPTTLKLTVAGAYVGAAVVASWLTVRRHTGLARKYQEAVVRFGALRSEIEDYSPSREGRTWTEFAASFRARWDAAAQEVPSVPQKWQSEATKQVETIRDEARPVLQHAVPPPIEHLRELVRKYKQSTEPQNQSETSFIAQPEVEPEIQQPIAFSLPSFETRTIAEATIVAEPTMDASPEEPVSKIQALWQLSDTQQTEVLSAEVPSMVDCQATSSALSMEATEPTPSTELGVVDFSAIAVDWQPESTEEVAVTAPQPEMALQVSQADAQAPLGSIFESVESRWNAPVEEPATVEAALVVSSPELPTPALEPAAIVNKTDFRCIRRPRTLPKTATT